MALPPLSSAPGAADRGTVDDARLISRFGAAMAALGPLERAPRFAAGVSGGADSMALALLANAWTAARGGNMRAFVVDHGLRPESATEAGLTVARLTALGIAAEILTLTDLSKGTGLAMRAREARYRVLTEACARHGILHLLLGHQAADQAETLMIRVIGGSGSRGLGGMAGVIETGTLRILRPLVTVPPSWLRLYLIGAGVAWIEDPSNLDRQAQRARLRLLRADPGGEGEGTQTLTRAARDAGLRRMASDIASAAALASRVTIYPEGFARLSPGPIPPEALAALLRTIAGAVFAPSTDRVAPVAANLMACTIGGVRLLPAGRLGDGWLLVREEVAAASSVPAWDGAVWDGRFRLNAAQALPVGTRLGALGDAAVRIREHTDLPAAVLRVMPAIWHCNILVAVPQLFYYDAMVCKLGCRVVFDPPRPLAGAPFCPA